MSKQRMVVEWSPHDESLFVVGADNLRLFESTCSEISTNSSEEKFDISMTTQRKRSFRLIKINSHISHLKCMEWYPFDTKPYMIATGASSGKVILSDFQDTRVRIVQEFLPKYSRPCNAVAWNKMIPTQIAAGFEKVRSDFCTLIWDINASTSHHDHFDGLHHHLHHLESGDEVPQTTGMNTGRASTIGGTLDPDKPMYELGNSEATVALSWLPVQPRCLATGTGFKWLRIYDLRAKITSPLSIVAHNKAVLGVVFDQHRPHMLATYTDGPQEAVKVWDIRRLDNTSGPVMSLQQTSKTLSQISWCPSKPGILVTSSQEEKWVSLWDVSKLNETPSTRVTGTQTGTFSLSQTSVLQVKKPFKRRYTSEPLSSFSWQYLPNLHQLGKDSITAAAFPNRLLTASITGEIEDISVHDSMPICLSCHGSVTFSCGKLLFGGIAPEHDSKTEDVSKQMYRLAIQGYSVTLSKCLKIFHPRSQYDQLRVLWQWVDQVEALRRIHANRIAQSKSGMGPGGGAPSGANSVAPGPLKGWPVDPNLLVIAGVKKLLGYSGDINDSVVTASSSSSILETNIISVAKVNTIIGCNFFEGTGRRLALLACNWDPDYGQGISASTTGDFSNNMSISTSRYNVPLHRSNSGAWSSQKQFEESIPTFANRSWNEASRYELRSIISRCESEGNFARAAALAVFHGDLQMGMAVLQRGTMLLSQSSSVHPPPPYSSDVLQLVAVAVAGYSSTAGPNASSMGGTSAGASLWATMCQQLLKRDEIISMEFPRYLHALLSFLYITCTTSSNSSSNASASSGINSSRSNQQQGLRRNATRRSWGSVDGLSLYADTTSSASTSSSASGNIYLSILNDPTLRLSDRIAFACRYLPAEELKTYLKQHEDDCEQYGRLEGLLLTGLDAKGLQLLQQYVDATGDIQTAALLSARVPASYAHTEPQLGRWIVQYQDLLNQWQLFHQRARFDVERTQMEDILNGFASLVNIGDLSSEELNAELNAPATLSIPPQLYVRCNFCNASLSLTSLLRLGGSHSSWLNRAKPKLTCCPSCRKSLPQCTLCLLPFGSLNPYFELAHRRSKQVAESITNTNANNPSDGNMSSTSGHVEHELQSKQEESLSQLSSIPFIEWFTWCQSCKHGGHAHHIADWFKSHSKCPVTDCECHCRELDHTSLFQKEEVRWLEQENYMINRSDAHGKNGMQVDLHREEGGEGGGSGGMKSNTSHQHQQQHATQVYSYQGSLIQKRTPLRSMSNVSLPGSLSLT